MRSAKANGAAKGHKGGEEQKRKGEAEGGEKKSKPAGDMTDPTQT
jgi:hypothetical protein